ncbi:GntR family transcriptional regulator [Jiangella anatolica]|nr:GntR family transcriptional regulator [Jiangella anatolica]
MALLRDRAYETILHDIISGALGPGDRISERAIATRLAISTMPVKDALRRLENEGFVTAVPRQGVFVSDTAITSVQDVVVTRAALEGLAARLTAARWAAGHVTGVERSAYTDVVRTMTQLADTGDLDRVVEANSRFHVTVRRLSANRPIIQFVGVLLGVDAAMRRHVLSDRSEFALGLREHLGVHEAIVAGDEDLAEQRMRSHILRSAHDSASRAS